MYPEGNKTASSDFLKYEQQAEKIATQESSQSYLPRQITVAVDSFSQFAFSTTNTALKITGL
jgi:hypothetical protein